MVETHLQRNRWHGLNDAAIEWPIADLLLRLLKVPDNGRNAVFVCGSESLRFMERNLVALDRVAVFVSKVGWFSDPFAVQQPEPAVKWGRGAGLLEKIRASPVAHALYQALGGFELAENIRCADVGIIHQVAGGVARAPFGEVERQVGKLRCLDLLANLAYVTDNGIRRW